ncbi:MAG: FtsB/FtsL family cell division protein [Gemmatimonadaceae bacterium]
MAKRRVAGRGRSVVALLLLAFVAVSTIVIWRRSFGIAQASELRQLERQRGQLQAELTRLERDIRDASTRARLMPVAERRLGMHVPLDSEVVSLERPAAADRAALPPAAAR